MNLLDHNVRFFGIRHALFEEMLKGLHLLSRQSSPRDHDAAPFPLEEDCKSFTFCGGWAQCFMKKQVLTGQEQGKGVKGLDFKDFYCIWLARNMCSRFTEDLHESANKQPAQHNCNEFCTLDGKNVGTAHWLRGVRAIPWFAGVHQLQRRLSKLLQETCMWCWWDGCEGGVIQFILVERLWIEAEA